MLGCFVYMMVFNATFNNISVISLGSGLLKMCLGDRYNVVVVFWANFCNRCLSSLVAISTTFFQIHETRTNRDNLRPIFFYLNILAEIHKINNLSILIGLKFFLWRLKAVMQNDMSYKMQELFILLEHLVSSPGFAWVPGYSFVFSLLCFCDCFSPSSLPKAVSSSLYCLSSSSLAKAVSSSL